jgi:hypothetical protein
MDTPPVEGVGARGELNTVGLSPIDADDDDEDDEAVDGGMVNSDDCDAYKLAEPERAAETAAALAPARCVGVIGARRAPCP